MKLLIEKGMNVEGCDVNPQSIQVCSEFAKVKLVDAHKLLSFYPANSYDLLTFFHVMEHLSSPYDFLRQVREITRKYILLAVPNSRIVMDDDREHMFSWNRFSIRNLVEKSGFEVISSTEGGYINSPKLHTIMTAVYPIISTLRINLKPELIVLAKKSLDLKN